MLSMYADNAVISARRLGMPWVKALVILPGYFQLVGANFRSNTIAILVGVV